MLTKKSFKKCKALWLLYEGDASKIKADHVEAVEDILAMMRAGSTLADVDLPGYRLHPWHGTAKKKAKIWSLDVSGNVRVLFSLDEDTGLFYDLDYGNFK
ncbi:type II toxin-antitoxin system RelE/ParE family toxin [Pseudomonas sp.]|uniref:type II toxin-antitoxin system RelE/ParE family toxin n=1 Tax=Pseudomonas sp. TaxID=306 RepID=UPI002CF76A33|nr:type II toxin-antitoxin system RelE/ParE family toxin [Pseudomonas sp.]HUE91864.1 type II toxin-antitoxin system RelE/ParE family toxin [Pseudomonas sp.]